jgi:hypothetical protein
VSQLDFLAAPPVDPPESPPERSRWRPGPPPKPLDYRAWLEHAPDCPIGCARAYEDLQATRRPRREPRRAAGGDGWVSGRRRARQRRWAGWVSDAAGPAVHLIADHKPSGQAVAAILEIRDAVIALQHLADREAGRWEDDGGPTEPAGTHRTFSLATGRQAGRR